jgi:hypothetical protein
VRDARHRVCSRETASSAWSTKWAQSRSEADQSIWPLIADSSWLATA